MSKDKSIYTFQEVRDTGKDENGYTISEHAVILELARVHALEFHGHAFKCSHCYEWAVTEYRIKSLWERMDMAPC